MPYTCVCGVRFEAAPAAGGEGVPCPACGAFVAGPEAGPSGLDVVTLSSRRLSRTRIDLKPPFAGAVAVEWPRSLVRELVVPVLVLAVLGVGITLVFTRLEGHPELQATCVILPLLAGLVLLKVVEAPRHVILHADADCREPVFYFRRERRVFRARYVLQAPDGRVLGTLEKRLLTWWTPRPWTLARADGTPWMSWTTDLGGLGYGAYFAALGLCFLCCWLAGPLAVWVLYSGGSFHRRLRVCGLDRPWAGGCEIRRPVFGNPSARLEVAGSEGRSDDERLVLAGTAAVILFNPSGAR